MKTIQWSSNGKVRLIDQTRLPEAEIYLELDDYRQVAAAIKEMQVRGAPAIGVAAAYGVALGVLKLDTSHKNELVERLQEIGREIVATRPTAVNLSWAVERMLRVAKRQDTVPQIKEALLAEAQRMEAEDEEVNRRLGRYGASLIEDGSTILTHCNAGALATVAYGTALGIIRAAWEEGKRFQVYAAETRPRLQGMRLTAWELVREGIPVTIIADTMVGHFLRRGHIRCAIVGADRIAANGDVANKIGTYNIAVLAKENDIPFYVAAPTSTVDLDTPHGDLIPIEERPHQEVTHIGGLRIAPEGAKVANPAFDVTPHRYVTAIVTEGGIIRAPYQEGLRQVVGAALPFRGGG
ncbi:MAG: S-methyl-5-thioribose-1-phosphate isomerase [Chloroflexi bacterium]|nr:S-methyl-5-thioribose-1-phosphate isomerase [Chloroflexota bacterium]